MAAYTTIDDPSAHFQSKLYTGTNNELVLTYDENSDLQPDMIWSKNRGRSSTSHVLSDTVRGTGKGIYPDLNNVEGDTNYITAVGSNGYTIAATDSVEINRDDDTFVSWNWKAGTSFTNDASSTSIGSIDSTGSANDTAGFSIVSFTGTGSAGTIKHGLSTAPTVVWIKNRATTNDWVYGHKNVGNFTNHLYINTIAAAMDDSGVFNDVAPTTSVFSVGGNNESNGSNPLIAYCFAEKQGYSKFGRYSGTGSTDGAFIYTGFQPSFVYLKRSDTNQAWELRDHKRANPYNLQTGTMYVHENGAEDNGEGVDMLSNGFKCRASGGGQNADTADYIYMAFAQHPFVTSTGIPTTAR